MTVKSIRFFGIFMFLAAWGCHAPPKGAAHIDATPVFDVRKFGAVGDGVAKDTAAVQKALDACIPRGGQVVIPAGNYVVGSLVMHSNTVLRLSPQATLTGSPDAADYPLIQVRWEGRWRQGHRALIHSDHADHITIEGPGKIIGCPKLGNLRNPRGPCIFEPIECRNVTIDGASFTYHRMWCIHPTCCDGVLARGLIIRSTKANGDGIDVDSCRDVQIQRCDIDTGDDAIAIKSGRGMEAVRMARPTEDVQITDCRLGSDFAGVGIGSEMSGGVRNVRMARCVFTRGANSIYMKGRIGRGGFVQDIRGQSLDCHARGFLRINFLNSGNQDSEPVSGDAAFPAVGQIQFSDVTVHCTTLLDAARLSPEKPLEGLSISNISGTCTNGITLCNIRNARLDGIQVTGYAGAPLATNNVTGSGLDGAVHYTPPVTPSKDAGQADAAPTSAP